MQKSWEDPDLLPGFDGERWGLWLQGRIQRCDDFEVRNKLKHWVPLSTLVAAPPGSHQLMPPSTIPALEDLVRSAIARRKWLTFLPFFLLAVGYFVYFFIAREKQQLGFAIAYGSIATFFYIEYFVTLKDSAAIEQRSKFAFWIYEVVPRTGFLVFLALGAISASIQYWLMSGEYRLDRVIVDYGVVIDTMQTGEVWRLVTASILHTSLLHWLGTWLLLMLIGHISWAMLGGPITLLMFVVSSVAGVGIQSVWAPHSPESATGFTFGLIGLLSMIVGATIVDRTCLPKGLALMFWCSLVAILAVVEMIKPTAGTAGHLVALAFGTLAGAGVQHLRHGARKRQSR